MLLHGRGEFLPHICYIHASLMRSAPRKYDCLEDLLAAWPALTSLNFSLCLSCMLICWAALFW